MIEEILNLVESYMKKEMNVTTEELEKTTASSPIARAMDWFIESGLHLAMSEETSGGASMQLADISRMVMKMGCSSASFSFSLVMNYLARFVLERIDPDHGEKGLVFCTIPETNIVPFHERVKKYLLITFDGNEARVSIRDGDTLKQSGEMVELLGLKGLSFVKICTEEAEHTISMKDYVEARKIFHAMLSSTAVGNAWGAYDYAVGYARERYQGGDMIITHGIVKEILGSMRMKLVACENAVLRISQKANADETALTKAFVTTLMEEVCSDGVQVLGGYGYMRDYPQERRLRDAKTLSAIGGRNTEIVKQFSVEEE